MIQIVNWLLTRKCNLNCDYCAINRDYKTKPDIYPELGHYLRNEMDTDFVLESLKRLKTHNPNMFHIFYGGEPLLRKDLIDIVKFCNDEDIHYTVITNNTEPVQERLEAIVNEVGLNGLTSSVDPIILKESHTDKDRLKKSKEGFERLIKYKDRVNDLVAEITVDNDTVHLLEPLVKKLSAEGISSSITFLDISKNPYYDFSNISDEKLLVKPTDDLFFILNNLSESDEVDIHMKDPLLTKTFNCLPSNLDCGLEKNVHNLTIDADGTVRLCLRIRGTSTAAENLLTYINKQGKLHPTLKEYIGYDKESYCKGCNWTCAIMSKLVDEEESQSDDLIHSDRR